MNKQRVCGAGGGSHVFLSTGHFPGICREPSLRGWGAGRTGRVHFRGVGVGKGEPRPHQAAAGGDPSPEGPHSLGVQGTGWQS